jgi:multimeric flavodoxin WrbA
MKRLLIVYHTQFGVTAQLARAAIDGARRAAGVASVLQRAADAAIDDVLRADALLIATSENFGGMAGMSKDFFERVYYPCENKLAGRPYSTIVAAGTDGAGALLQIDRVASGLRLRRVHAGVLYRSGLTAQAHAVPASVLAQCEELGATLAHGLAADVW